MIQKKTKLVVTDNSGASLAKCIHVNKKGKNTSFSSLGEMIKITVKRLKKSIPKKKVKKSEVLTALVVYTKNHANRKNGIFVKGNNNYIVLLNKENNNIVSSRIILPVCLEIRDTNFSKILSLAPSVI